MTRFMRVFYGQPNSGAQSLDPLDSPYQQFDYYEPKATVIKKALPWVLAAGFLSLCLLAVLIALIFPNGLDQSATPTSTPALTTTYKALATVGAACGVSSDCIPSAYCTGTVCACAAQLYFDTSSQTCTSRKTYGDSCSASSECEYFVYLDCLNGICDCDPSTFFWNPVTQKCEDQKGLAQACSGVSSSECFTSALSCTYYNGGPDLRCVCPTNQLTYYYSFQTQTCVPRLGQGSQCDQYGHFECVDNAWCTTFPQDSTYRCSCYPTYYWDSSTYSCRAKKQYNGTCTYTYECFDYQGQVCNASSGQCGCPTGTFWNMTNCDPLKPYAGVCNKTSDCLYTNLICTFRPEQQDYACLCPNGTYYALSNNSCVYYLNINDVCTDNYQCPINATCTFIPTTSTKTCQCASNFYYNVVGTNQCLPLKNYTSTCASDAECNSILGLYCSTANQCDCAAEYYFNGNECQIKKGNDAYTFGQYCANANECRSSYPNCYEGRCIP